MKLYPTPEYIEFKENKYFFEYASLNESIPSELIKEIFSKNEVVLSKNIKPNITYIKKSGLEEEGYELTIDKNGASVYYTFESGALYATLTLCQLINMKEVSYLEIKDSPSIRNRILSFDISRGKIPTIEHFKDIIDNLFLARYNVLCLYLDRLAIQLPSFKDYWLNDAITIDELREIKKYCNERNIKLSIEIQSFGHLEWFLKIPEFSHLSNSADEAKPNGDLNPLDAGSIEFVDKLIGDVAPFIDADFISVGGDEVGSLTTGKTKDAVAENGTVAVYMEHMQKVCDLVYNKYHKKAKIYNDMFMNIKNSEEENLKNLKSFPKNAIIGDWGYESEYEYHSFEKYNALFEKSGIPFFNLASTGLFNQYICRTYNTCINAQNSCYSAYKHKGEYAGISTWGDTGNSQFMIMEYMGLYIFGATAWNALEFQLSDVLNYMNKYVYKSDKMAEAIADIGDAAWFAKGKFPCTNGFVFADRTDFENPLIWNGPHVHAGIDKIYIWDAIDEYGCKKAISFIENITKRIESIKMNCKNADIEKKKILLNLLMFITAVKSGYMKLCLLKLDDIETADRLSCEILEAYNKILKSFKELWLTENRENGSEIFINFITNKKNALEGFLKK